jgi:thiol:disulfide interchange protein
MKKTKMTVTVVVFLLTGIFSPVVNAQDPSPEGLPESIKSDIVSISLQQQYETIRPGDNSAIAIHFVLKENWHFYASAKTAPGQMNLKVKIGAEDLIFQEPIFPGSEAYFDKATKKNLNVFSGSFTVYVPFKASEADMRKLQREIMIDIDGAVCSDVMCRMVNYSLATKVKIDPEARMGEVRFVLPARKGPSEDKASYSAPIALPLAFVAGVSLNIMPCVWPILPIIIMRLIGQARESKKRAIGLGLSFCLGILLFFAALAALNIILRLGYGTTLQWGDHFRNPAFVIGMVVLLVVLSLFLFGVFSFGVPAGLTEKAGSGRGYWGSVGMGFLAAVLSTPCSFAILAAAFAWAQGQPLGLSTAAIMLIGVGMAAPYAILTSMPKLLNRLPKPGRWMELFKQGMGFLLLVVAVKLFGSVPMERRIGVLYYAVIMGFCVWMWGGWVSFATKSAKKWTVRAVAVIIAVGTAFWFLPAPKAELIAWQEYEPARIERAVTEGQPVLIKFTADWCASCAVVDKTVYSRAGIAKLVKRKGLLAVKADTTLTDSTATQDLKNIYREPGIPVSLLFIPGRAEPERLHGILIGAKLKELLESLPDKETGSKLD